MNGYTKTSLKITLGLCLLGGALAAYGATDNPAQAAARAALMQKLSRPDAWAPQPLTPVTDPLPAAAPAPVEKSAALAAPIVLAKSVTARSASEPVLVAAIPAAMPAVPAPGQGVVASSVMASAAPVAAASTTLSVRFVSSLIGAFLALSLLIVSILLLKLRQLKLRLRELDYRA